MNALLQDWGRTVAIWAVLAEPALVIVVMAVGRRDHEEVYSAASKRL